VLILGGFGVTIAMGIALSAAFARPASASSLPKPSAHPVSSLAAFPNLAGIKSPAGIKSAGVVPPVSGIGGRVGSVTKPVGTTLRAASLTISRTVNTMSSPLANDVGTVVRPVTVSSLTSRLPSLASPFASTPPAHTATTRSGSNAMSPSLVIDAPVMATNEVISPDLLAVRSAADSVRRSVLANTTLASRSPTDPRPADPRPSDLPQVPPLLLPSSESESSPAGQQNSPYAALPWPVMLRSAPVCVGAFVAFGASLRLLFDETYSPPG
jgi:hypothetical protein